MADGAYITAGAAADIPPGGTVVVEVEGVEVLVANVAGTYYAVENECSHRGCMLGDGDVEGAEAICPCHGAVFDLRTGRPLEGPTDVPLRRYATRVVAGMVEVGQP